MCLLFYLLPPPCCSTGVALPLMYLFTSLTLLMVFCILTESFSHLSVPALQFYLRMSVVDPWFSVLFVFFQQSMQPSYRSRSSFTRLLGKRLLSMCIFENGRDVPPSSSDLLYNSKLYTCLKDLGTFFQESLERSFLAHLQKIDPDLFFLVQWLHQT